MAKRLYIMYGLKMPYAEYLKSKREHLGGLISAVKIDGRTIVVGMILHDHMTHGCSVSDAQKYDASFSIAKAFSVEVQTLDLKIWAFNQETL